MLFDRQLVRQAKYNSLALLLSIISGLFCAGFIILQARFTAGLINAAFLAKTRLDVLILPIGLLAGVICLRAFFQYLTDVNAGEIGISIKEKLRIAILDRIQQRGPVYTASENSGELTNILTEGVDALDPYFSQYVPQIILAGFIPLMILINLWPQDLLSFFILLLTAPLLPVFMYLLGSLSEKSTQAQWQKLSRLGSYFYETIQGMHLLLTLNQTQNRGKEISQHDADYRKLTLNVLRLTFLSAFVLEFISTIGTAVIAVEIGLRLVSGSLQFESALFILLLAPEFYLPLRQLGVKFHAGMSGRAASIRIFQLLAEPIEDRMENIQTKQQKEHNANSIQLDDFFPIKFFEVGARYPGISEFVLQKVSFEIQIQNHIALVGRSGMGKTTIAYLLMGLLKPAEGEITFNKVHISAIHDSILRSLISWVPQTPFIFSGTIAENISMFDGEADLDRIREAARAARLDDFISTIPKGLQGQVGERGLRISTGQAQRVAIARAFYRDTPILVLDEPTSSIDAQTEHDLIDSLNLLTIGKTVLTIAHRLTTIRSSDRILVVDQGSIVEQGSHSSLLSSDGLYARILAGGGHA